MPNLPRESLSLTKKNVNQEVSTLLYASSISNVESESLNNYPNNVQNPSNNNSFRSP